MSGYQCPVISGCCDRDNDQTYPGHNKPKHYGCPGYSAPSWWTADLSALSFRLTVTTCSALTYHVHHEGGQAPGAREYPGAVRGVSEILRKSPAMPYICCRSFRAVRNQFQNYNLTFLQQNFIFQWNCKQSKRGNPHCWTKLINQNSVEPIAPDCPGQVRDVHGRVVKYVCKQLFTLGETCSRVFGSCPWLFRSFKTLSGSVWR